MKRIITLVTVLMISLPGTSLSLDSQAAISPSIVHAGDKVTLTYNAGSKGAALRRATSITGEVMLVPGAGSPRLITTPLKRKGVVWSGTFTLAGNDAVYLLARFVSGKSMDDNGANAWDALVYGTDGQPVRSAHLQRAYALNGRAVIEFKRAKDAVAAKAELVEEQRLYPDNLTAVTYRWSMMLRESPGDVTKEEVRRELESLYESRKNDEAAVNALLSTFEQTGQSDRAAEIRKGAIAANPKGPIALGAAEQSVNAESDPAKRLPLVEALNANFPVTGDQLQTRLRLLTNACIAAGEYSRAGSVIASMTPPSAMFYNKLAWTMIEKGADITQGVEYAKSGLDILRKTGSTGMPPYLTPKQWKSELRTNRGILLDTYGFGLFRLDRFEDAAVAYEESYVLLDKEEHDVNVHLIQCLSKLGRTDRVLELTMNEIRDGNASADVVGYYTTAYVRKHGSDQGLEASLAALKRESGRKTLEAIMKGRVNKPAPDFSLKDLNGKTVTLSSLKGKVVVIDFWATWCGPCKQSFPFLQRVYDKYKGNEKVAFLALDTWERVSGPARDALVRKFIADTKYTFPVLFDEGVVDAYGVEGIPTKFVIDKTGKIQFKKIGSEGEEMLQNLSAQIDLLLSEDFYSMK